MVRGDAMKELVVLVLVNPVFCELQKEDIGSILIASFEMLLKTSVFS